jgi:hypothetical protein
MKKTIVLLLLSLGVTTFSFAQKGSFLLYGNVTYESNTNNNRQPSPGSESSKSDIFNLTPGIGYQFNGNWTAGLVLGYTHTGSSTTNSANSSSNDLDEYGIGPFLRYSHSITSWVSVYGQFQAEYQTEGKTNAYDATPPFSLVAQHQLAFYLYPAFFFPIKNGLGLNLSFGGVTYTTTHVNTVGNVGSQFNLTFGSSGTIGISKNFGGK